MRRVIARELMDEPGADPGELAGNVHDLRFANAHLGGLKPVLREVRALGARTVLDVGCGFADLPLALVRDAERRGQPLEVTCLDRSEQIVALAREATGDHPALRFVVAHGEALPFGDGAFDVAICTLALHHFDPPAAVALLRELRRVCTRGPVVCDLRRSPTAYAAIWLWSRTSRNRYTRHDGPLSVRRAYTPAEAVALARDAGWSAPRVRDEAFFRMTLLDG